MGSFDANKEEKSRLLAGMDKTMTQKLAFTSAHFQLADGARILDVGCGTGYGSYQFALINPHLQVVALDYDRDYIERARAQYPLPNLTFVQGDARNFDAGGERFDAIFNSSILHEVYSFSGYSQQAVVDSLQMQMNAVRDGGVILIRDFVRPENPEAMIYLDLPDERDCGTALAELSAADMLRLYANWACAEKPEEQRGFFLEECAGAKTGWQRFYLSHDWANEFILRKDYRDRFYIEAKEKYGYFSPREYRTIPESLGARVLYTSPYTNPWIVENRLRGKVQLFNENRESICLPPTNFIGVMQKVPAGHGVVVREHKVVGQDLRYLKTESFQNTKSGETVDLVSRPGRVFDILPYYLHDDGQVDIYARSDYPRPLVNMVPRQMSPRLDGKTWSGYMVEPFAVANQESDREQAAINALAERAGIDKAQIAAIEAGPDYYPALADVNECVGSAFIRLKEALTVQPLSPGFSGFQENGDLRPFNLQNMMRGIQVGMFPEARLELCAYALARKLALPLPEWMGHNYKIDQTTRNAVKLKARKHSDVFTPVELDISQIYGIRSLFSEVTTTGKVVAQRALEFVMPVRAHKEDVSNNMAVIVPVTKGASGELLVGLQTYHYPALSQAGESDQLQTLPVQRLRSHLRSVESVCAHIASVYGGTADDVMPLGEGYFPSMGISPDRAYPFIVNMQNPDAFLEMQFVPVKRLFEKINDLRDAHLMLAVNRLTHAFGLWPQPQAKTAPMPPSP